VTDSRGLDFNINVAVVSTVIKRMTVEPRFRRF
jgi:hypothetical protein